MIFCCAIVLSITCSVLSAGVFTFLFACVVRVKICFKTFQLALNFYLLSPTSTFQKGHKIFCGWNAHASSLSICQQRLPQYLWSLLFQSTLDWFAFSYNFFHKFINLKHPQHSFSLKFGSLSPALLSKFSRKPEVNANVFWWDYFFIRQY